MSCIVAIVGRPNVGKSSLFNILTGSRAALVANFSGLTRDRQYGRDLKSSAILIDTGGIGKDSSDLSKDVIKQTNLAIEEADILFFMVDGKDGLMPLDEEIAKKLRKRNKPVRLIVNKIDNAKDLEGSFEFDQLGFKDKAVVSTAHNLGLDALKKALLEISPVAEPIQEKRNDLRISILGRPNVGKSTLINKLSGFERVLVSSESGTTRDSIEVPVKEREITLIDTAGVRKKSVSKGKVEQFSISQSIEAIKKSNVVIHILDAVEPLVDQDMHLLGLALSIGKPVLIVANKIDLLNKEELANLTDHIFRRLSFAKFVGVSLISAKEGKGLKKLLNLAEEAYLATSKDFSTSVLNKILNEAIKKQPPPLIGRFRPKMRYIHQGGKNPPLFIIHGKNLKKLSSSYKKYMENYFREHLKLRSTPLIIDFLESENPYKDKPNVLSGRQKKKRKRIIKRSKK
ncbi:MAG TPA: ribosome biogenesis GTPase Der [Gammaproteobacteria bacterium]|jgi:GTP-binding protein|nr:ribosome biogenesis GTPase Der [Gammaproteobacteria bacterium]HIB74596.1 ribosome biogenesis GTPase Der [Gammaproteobacteria bacterium]HIG49229.1 ribosome biogenesis GTPase Der [Gammaproteobacteria bacterium]HIM22141.1 ribosome biogenesis GTPase Der [Gammaproteobacteria bacterium]HIO05141.1 ribosome biogenesis GTPase Der [Gammaproteobacteria bacterium]